jgi:ACS family tartrate transporter-like MFS transporter
VTAAVEIDEAAVFRKVTRRLMPFLCLLYFVNVLDRANVSFASLTMLAIDEEAYALGAGIFYLGYCLLEVPSNFMLSRVGARRWIARILVSWGLISSAMMFVNGPTSFYVIRFLLGCAEAGFFPGIVLYLTYWYPPRRRARAVATFMLAAPIVSMLNGPIAGVILKHLDGAGGLAGWQWLFLIEGMPAVVLGIVTLGYLTDRPEHATWLAPNERAWLTEHVAAEQTERQHPDFRRALGDLRVWHLIAICTTIALGISVHTYYFPKLIHNRFPSLGVDEIGLASAPVGVFTLCAMLTVGKRSDRSGERRLYVVGLALVAAGGWLLSLWGAAPFASYAGLLVSQVAMMCMWGPFWSMTTAHLGPRVAVGGIALTNAIGNLGAYLGPRIMGWLLVSTGDFAPGLAVMALNMVGTAVLATLVRPTRTAAGPS